MNTGEYIKRVVANYVILILGFLSGAFLLSEHPPWVVAFGFGVVVGILAVVKTSWEIRR